MHRFEWQSIYNLMHFIIWNEIELTRRLAEETRNLLFTMRRLAEETRYSVFSMV